MPDFQKGAVLYRKLRYRKGHGVHSPFVYNLITKVIEEKLPYCAFEKIKKIIPEPTSKKIGIKTFSTKRVKTHKFGSLLFRLINFFKCNVVIQIGSPEITTSLYMASARSECKCIVLDEDKVICSKIKELSGDTELDNLEIKCGNYPEQLNKIFSQEKKVDLVFINIPKHDNCRDIFSKCISNAEENCIFVINGIRKNQNMRRLWKEIIQNPQITITIDLYTSGIFFLKKNIYKQHYKTYFDHGKEQNIHKNRRPRFYFFGRRKKSS